MKMRNLFKHTHQKGNKTTILQPHKLLDNVLDEVPISFIFIHPDGKIQKLNKQACKELEIKEESLIGEDFLHHFAILNKKENILPHILEILKNGIPQIELPKNSFLHQKASDIYILVTGYLNAVYKDGKLTQIIFTYRNATNELTQEYILNMALSQTKIFPWSFDMERNVMIIDSRYFEHLKIPTKDNTLTPEQFYEMMHPDDRAAVIDALNHQINGDLIVDPVFYRLLRGDGTWEWFQAQSTYLGQMAKVPYRIVGVCMSIQDHKDIEATLIQARNKAEQSDKLKSAFLANMSHEIRTPLNAIVGFSSILASTQEENEKKEYINIIENNNALLLQLISDILDISKIEAGTMEFVFTDFELNALMHELESTLSDKIKSDQTILQFDPPETSLFIHGEKNRLSQILINLITNAIKFTERGSINFGYKPRLSDKTQSIYFYVKDTGCGIPPDKISNIFERFVKLDSFAQGTGLGLSICQTIVENLGGEIGVESQQGKGSMFWFTIPYQQGVQLNKNDIIPNPTPVDKNKLVILIAEDNESNFKLFETILRNEYKIIHAWNGQEAVDMFKKYDPHLILMDLNMPVMNGYEATKEIRKFSEFVPIIAVTAFAYSSDEQMAMKKGFTGYMSKPINPRQLKLKIMDTLSKCLNLF